MINDPGKAASVASEAHRGQLYGDALLQRPSYFQGHLVSVAKTARALAEAGARMYLNVDDVEITAWLHDVVEDTDMTLADLAEYAPGDQPEYVLQAIELLTRLEGEGYAEYINNIAEADTPAGRIAQVVKIADLINNLADTDKPGLAGRYFAALQELV